MRATPPVLALALAAALARPAAAQPEAQAAVPEVKAAAKADDEVKKGISGILGRLDWGASHGDVLKSLKAAIDERYAEQLEKTSDPIAIDRILRRKAEEFGRIEKTYVRFTGQRTGYESSLIARDFVPDASEAVLRVDDRGAQRYYFFKDDRLWKILVAYSAGISRSVPFPEFVRQVQAKYGRPAEVDWYTPPGGARTIRSATWRDERTELVVEDRTEFFGTFVMKFLDREIGVQLEAERTTKQPRKGGVTDDPLVADALAEITSDDPEAVDEAVVDRLTGVSHEVDLESGRPEYDVLNRGTAQSPTYPDAPKRAKKGRKKKGEGKRSAKKRDDRSAETPSEPLIIY